MSRLYRPREPSRTVLYQSVCAGWPALQAQCAERDRPLPGYVEEEMERYLRCGILAHGFARVHCPGCSERDPDPIQGSGCPC